jgi:hypothetical protein
LVRPKRTSVRPRRIGASLPSTYSLLLVLRGEALQRFPSAVTPNSFLEVELRDCGTRSGSLLRCSTRSVSTSSWRLLAAAIVADTFPLLHLHHHRRVRQVAPGIFVVVALAGERSRHRRAGVGLFRLRLRLRFRPVWSTCDLIGLAPCCSSCSPRSRHRRHRRHHSSRAHPATLFVVSAVSCSSRAHPAARFVAPVASCSRRCRRRRPLLAHPPRSSSRRRSLAVFVIFELILPRSSSRRRPLAVSGDVPLLAAVVAFESRCSIESTPASSTPVRRRGSLAERARSVGVGSCKAFLASLVAQDDIRSHERGLHARPPLRVTGHQLRQPGIEPPAHAQACAATRRSAV